MKITSSKLKTTKQKILPGSIVMTVDDQVYVTKHSGKVLKLIKEIEKKHHKKPLITVVPREDTLILFLL